MSRSRICAVVVTHNRLLLLQQCLVSLHNQTRKPDDILVINNSSTDGTGEWLRAQSDLRFITQENSGGAGGFNTGIRQAFEDGYDWIWCMDDDGYPDQRSLEKLLRYKFYGPMVINSLVVSSSDNSKLAFFLYDQNIKRPYKTRSDIDGTEYILGGCFFNGTLLHKDVVEKVGLPNKELFIHGDEIEYFLRIRSMDFPIVTLTDSLFYHPPAFVKIFTLGKFYHVFYEVHGMKRYYRMRNLVYLFRKYKYYSLVRLLKVFICDSAIILLQGNFRLLMINVKGFIDGILWEKK